MSEETDVKGAFNFWKQINSAPSSGSSRAPASRSGSNNKPSTQSSSQSHSVKPQTSKPSAQLKKRVPSIKRYNMLAAPHKGFRALWSEIMVETGGLDVENEAEFDKLIDKTATTCRLYTHHNRMESNYWLPIMKEKGDRTTAAKWGEDHQEHLDILAEMPKKLQAIRDNPSIEQRKQQIYGYFLEFTEYVKSDLEHTPWEETTVIPWFQDTFSDEEMQGFVAKALSEDPLDGKEMAVALPTFFRSVNIEEGAEILFAVKATTSHAPPEVWEGVLQSLRNIVGPEKLEKTLNFMNEHFTQKA